MSDCRWGAALFAAAALIRLVCWMGSAVFGTDSCHYLLMADWMADGRWHDALLVAYHPFYPLLIAATRVLGAGTETAGSLIAILLGAGALLPLYDVVRAVFGRPAAVLAGLLYAFHPAFVETQSDVMTEGCFMFFLFGAMALTRRVMDEPSLPRAALLGASAAAAFLTRVEGLLAIALALGWPALEALRRRTQFPLRAGGVLLTFAVVILALSPYLLWVKSVRGHWALSYKPSVVNAEKAVGVTETGALRGAEEQQRLYRLYGLALLRLSLYGLLAPFMLVGLASLRPVGAWKSLFYLSFPLGQLGGILFALRRHDFMSDRYVMAGMALLGGLAAYGMVVSYRWAERRRPGARWRPAACGVALVLLIAVLSARSFKPRRLELLSYRPAAEWLRARQGSALRVSGVEQVAYYCGSRSYYLPSRGDELEAFLEKTPLDYVTYSQKDVEGRPDYVAMLRSCPRLEAPLEFEGPPGSWKVYFQRVK